MRRALLAVVLCAIVGAEEPPAEAERHADAGLECRSMTRDEARSVGHEESAAGAGAGVTVESVAEPGAAAAAGLKPGDVVLTAGGRPVRSNDQLQDLIRVSAPGDSLGLGVLRPREGGAPEELKLTLALAAAKGPAWTGIQWEYTGPDGLEAAVKRAKAEGLRVLVGTSGSEVCCPTFRFEGEPLVWTLRHAEVVKATGPFLRVLLRGNDADDFAKDRADAESPGMTVLDGEGKTIAARPVGGNPAALRDFLVAHASPPAIPR